MKKNNILNTNSADFEKTVLTDQMLLHVAGGCPVPTVFTWIPSTDNGFEPAWLYPVPNPPSPRPHDQKD